jgi:NAD(P)H-dependent flavin oxidoreductase YrpB (nitropropane dioxygenase family)
LNSPLTLGTFELGIPIIQGGMAVKISLSSLASAVSNLGGLGVLGGSGLTPDELRREIREARSLTREPLGVNLMVALSNFLEMVKIALEEKVEALLVGAGFSREVFKLARDAGVAVIPIVSSLKAAILSERMGAKAVVVEGKEAGGHLGTNNSLLSLLKEIAHSLRIPVFAAGGIVSRDDMEEAFRNGASGVQMGTLLAVTEESNAHTDWKKYLINSTSESSVLIESPAGLPARALENSFIKRLKSGAELTPKIIPTCRKCLRSCSKRFCILDALLLAQAGNVEDGLIFSGEKVDAVKKISSVKEVFLSLGVI